jgi:hypothetical protein
MYSYQALFSLMRRASEHFMSHASSFKAQQGAHTQEVDKSRGVGRAALRALRFCSDSSDAARDSSDGRGRGGSAMVTG